MKRCIKRVAILMLFLALGTVWWIRVAAVNREIQEIKTLLPVQKFETVGEWVPFGDNYLLDCYCNGYSIRIDNFRIVEYEDYMKELAENVDYMEEYSPIKVNKVLEVEVTLSAWLFGEDFYTALHTEWFEAVNSPLVEFGCGQIQNIN